MMMANSDLVRAARHLIEVHGKNAANIVDKRARMLEYSELSAAQTWRSIAQAIRDMQAI